MSSVLAFSLVAGLGIAAEKSNKLKGLCPGKYLIRVKLFEGSVNSKYNLNGFLRFFLVINREVVAVSTDHLFLHSSLSSTFSVPM